MEDIIKEIEEQHKMWLEKKPLVIDHLEAMELDHLKRGEVTFARWCHEAVELITEGGDFM